MHPFLLLLALGSSTFEAVAALGQQQQDGCATISDKQHCHWNIECIWCEKQGGHGRCMNWTGSPEAGESCDALVGCSGHRTKTLCDKDAKCKWCTWFAPSLPFCGNITEYRAANCDKPIPAHPTAATAAPDVSHPLAAVQEPTLLELVVENTAHSFGKSLYMARGSSSCWGIPGLGPQMDGSYILVPDEKNTACSCMTSSCDFFSSNIVGFNFDYSWDLLHILEKQAAEVRWIGHGNRTKDGSIVWTYSCAVLSVSNPSWKVTCQERPSKQQYAKFGYTVTIEDAASTSHDSSRLFLMGTS